MTDGIPKTAKGINHPKLDTSTSKAKAIQYKPEVKCPKPNHHPSLKASLRLLAFSIIRKKPLKPIIANGNKYKGGRANVTKIPKKAESRFFFMIYYKLLGYLQCWQYLVTHLTDLTLNFTLPLAGESDFLGIFA